MLSRSTTLLAKEKNPLQAPRIYMLLPRSFLVQFSLLHDLNTKKKLLGRISEYNSNSFWLRFVLFLMTILTTTLHQLKSQEHTKYYLNKHAIKNITDEESHKNDSSTEPHLKNRLPNEPVLLKNESLSKEENYSELKVKTKTIRNVEGLQQRDIDDAVEFGFNKMRELYLVSEPRWFKMGLHLEKEHPNFALAAFKDPSEKASKYVRFGYAVLQAKAKLVEMYPERRDIESSANIYSDTLLQECPIQGTPRCPPNFVRYRTTEGTCNNIHNPWIGSAMLPMQRFLPPSYSDGIQSVRQSVRGQSLPSARDISTTIHRDQNTEMHSVTLMFMQWGQFLDHDIVSTVQARTFNRSVPRCCRRGGVGFLPQELTHPECLPIAVDEKDWFLRQFGIRCLEFVRSAPTTRIDCHLGCREQISQVTAFIDASTIYGSDAETAESLRLFSRGQLLYGRSRNREPLQPPDPPNGELCRLGAITTDCFKSGDFRVGDQPGLTSLHTIWLRYHNRLSNRLSRLNPHWSDEKLYQETRRIIGALVQHITYKEFLPLVLGSEVMKLFELDLEHSGYYNGYNSKLNPAPSNSFATAAFRFGHSLVPNSFIRTDNLHRTINNSVALHDEQENSENIWSLGSLDRLILGLCNQPSQRRDEFISKELTNHLFRSSGFPFGIDLAATNIQRGRDHGIPSYTTWREPCRLSHLQNWTHLERVMSVETVKRFQTLYADINDIDLFSGGLAEKSVRGGIVGPTFACIIAQQFHNLRKGDRFWYENGHSESAFTPAQLQEIRRVRFSHVLCRTAPEIVTLQPFVFLSADSVRNVRMSCNDESTKFDLDAWIERSAQGRSIKIDKETREGNRIKRRKIKPTPRNKRKRTTKPSTTTSKRFDKIVTPPGSYSGQQDSDGYYRPFKLIVTNYSTPSFEPTRPSRPTTPYPNLQHNSQPYGQTGGYGTVDKRPFTGQPIVDKYLISINQTIPPHTFQSSPYHVNINIHFVPQHVSDVTKPPLRRNSTFYGNNFVTRNPQPQNNNRPQGFDTRPPIHQSSDDRIVFEEEPFAISNKIPFNNFYTQTTTVRPVIPPYLYLNENEHDLYNPRPTDSHKNNYDYDYDQQYKQNSPFVKISSIQGHKYPTAEQSQHPLYISAQNREGDLDLTSESENDSPIVQVDVMPSEVKPTNWKTYNASDETIEPWSIWDYIPADDANASYSAELPRLMEIPVF